MANSSRTHFPAKGLAAGRRSTTGLGQLTLVEHALCPLDSAQSLRENLIFETGYYYSDKNRHQRKAAVKVTCPAGLSPTDELFLWGLLALTFADCDPTSTSGADADSEFHATPHFCLRKLGLIDQHGKRGGRQYQQFADALDRLAQVSYASDAFYDPVRAEHRKVRFGFLSYSLPLDPQSSRAWRIAWDPIFFDLVRPLGGQFRFDLESYRALDPAARRLFLLVSKIFDRRDTTPRFDLEHLAVDVLGFSPTVAPRNQRIKLHRVMNTLVEAGILVGPVNFEKQPRSPSGSNSAGPSYSVVLHRGPRFNKAAAPDKRTDSDSPLWDGLLSLGFDAGAVGRLLKEFPRPMVREWLDITLAARERFGAKFFTRSPQAYLVDGLQHAKSSGRTAPEWWHELRSRERERVRSLPGDRGAKSPVEQSASQPSDHTAAIYRRVTQAVFEAQVEPAAPKVTPPNLSEVLRPIR